MNTLHFKYAVEVEKTGSISQAAENLFMAQPNLSKAIKELEDTLDISIFKRTSKGVIPTPQGKEFLEYAKRILAQLERMEKIYIPKEERGQRQSIKISVPRSSYISEGIADFAAELDTLKSIELNICEADAIETISNVAENGYSFGIIRYKTQNEGYYKDYLKEKGLESELIWEFESRVLMSDIHPLAGNREISASELYNRGVCIKHGTPVVPYLLSQDDIAPPEDIKVNKEIRLCEGLSALEILKKLPEAFMWSPPISMQLLDKYRLVQRKCHIDNNMFKDVLIYHTDYSFTDRDRKLLKKIYDIKNEIAFSK